MQHNWCWFDPTVETEDEAKQKRKRYARQYHPDIVTDDGRTMAESNSEYQSFILYLNRPQPTPVQVSTTDPTAYWSAVVKSAKVNVGGGTVPKTGQQAPSRP